MTVVIVNVEKGSPADKAGKLKQGQIIESKLIPIYEPQVILSKRLILLT